MKTFISNYSNDISNLLQDKHLEFERFCKVIKKIKKPNSIFICGNGGSSSIASHVSVDFLKMTNLNFQNFSDDNLITCFANDFGYENWLKKALQLNLKPKDIVILISSSGKSKNMLNAAKFLKKTNTFFITFTGFSKNNFLNKNGNLNIWINSTSYNYIEMAHHIFLVAAIDYLKKK